MHEFVIDGQPKYYDELKKALDGKAKIDRELEEQREMFEAKENKYSFYNYVKKNDLQQKLENAECPICLDEFKQSDKVIGL